MDSPSVSFPVIKITTQTITNPQFITTFTPPWPSTKTKTTFTLSRTRCLKKPDTNTNNQNSNPAFKKNPNSNSSEPISNTPHSSPSFSSSSSPLSSRGLVFDLGHKDSWDSAELGCPVVKRFLSDEEERWYMWFYGRSSGSASDSIGLAVSSNGVHWERGKGLVQSSQDVGLVMKCSEDWWAFDTTSIRPSEIVIMSSSILKASSAVYWLYYTGFSSERSDFSDHSNLGFNLENPDRFEHPFDESSENYRKGKILKSLPGLAISQDGRHWARIEGEHHSGALFDVGVKGEWDSSFICSPQVVFHGKGDLRMYYHSFDEEKGQFGIGVARSRDGIKWMKLGKIIGGGRVGGFDEFGVINGRVLKYNNSNKKKKNEKDGAVEYVMAYEGVGEGGERSIGLALSFDGLKDWRRVGEDAILRRSEEEDGWDSNGVGGPCLVKMDGEEDEWRLYYRGFGSDGKMGIGMAVSKASDFTSFTRWNGFHL